MWSRAAAAEGGVVPGGPSRSGDNYPGMWHIPHSGVVHGPTIGLFQRIGVEKMGPSV